ncbi:MAG TPA: SCO family protein [Rhodocyclaceae bacterium]|nr:SCO family protein [Rhodocyclaceae bacterium]
MRLMRALCLFFLCLTGFGARAEAPPPLEFTQRLAAPLPLDLPLRDEAGRPVRLGDYFGRAPVVLVLGYFECPNLCSTVLDGVLEGLGRTGLPGSAYRLLAVSIDPREGPREAGRRAVAYRTLLAGGEAHFLTGAAGATGRLAGSAGFPYAWDREHGQYMHPAGFLVAAPGGRISRYFLGVRFAPRDLRLALVEAAAGRTGSLQDRLLLLCSHFEPRTGRYTVAVMAVVRAVCLIVAAALGLWIWRRRAGRAP